MEKIKSVIVKGAFIIIVFSMLSFLSNNSASIPWVDNGSNQISSVSENSISEIQSQSKTSFTLDIKDYPKLSSYDYVDAIVTFKDGITVDFVGVDVKYNYENLNGFSAKISTALYNHFQNVWYVNSIHENGLVYADETLDWGVDYINAERVWGGVENAINTYSNNLAGRTIKVAVLDTGIDTDHEDLDANYVSGYDYVNSDNDPTDDNGHGTHCAGIIGAVDNSIGVIGVAPRVSIYGVKVLGTSGSGSIDNVVAGIEWAINNDMDVISMSLSTTSHYAILEDACDDAYNAGIVVIAAAGNNNHNSINYPARYDSVIAVGAINSNGDRADYSNWGSNYGDELEIVAPGVDVYSTMPEHSCYLTQYYGYSTDYDDMSGTSMATPMVAAVTALLLSVEPDLTNVQVRTILQDTAVDLGTTGWDEEYGYGRVDALAVLDYAADMPFREDGNSYDWLTTDYSYDRIVSNYVYDGRTCLRHYEDTSHYRNYMLAEGPIVDLTDWNGNNDLFIQFSFRAQSNYAGSSVTQFRLLFFDLSTNSYLTFTNPTVYNQYIVLQSNRNGQTWISGKDSGWQSESFNLLASEFDQYAGTKKLQVRWGHYDAWSYDWYQRQYLDNLEIVDGYLPYREEGNSYIWEATDIGFNKVINDKYYNYRNTIYNYEDISHYGNYMLAEGPVLDLTDWDGSTTLCLSFAFRCQSNIGSSSVTQFRLLFYDRLTNNYLTFTNPTVYSQYIVHQSNRNGQSWISGTDSGWQTVSFNLVTSEFSSFAGTGNLQVRFGHYDAWSADWFQREYLDYLYIEEQVTPNAPRNLNGLDDGVDSITLTWQSPSNLKAEKYNIYRYNSGKWIQIKTVTHVGTINSLQHWTENGLLKNVIYQYRVCAVNSVGVMGPYAYWSGTIGTGPVID